MNHDAVGAFLDNLRLNGYEPLTEIRVNSTGWERLCYGDEKRSKTSGGYKITQNSDGSLSGNFGSSKDPLGFRFWRSDNNKEMSWEETAAQKLARANHKKYLEEKELEHAEKTGTRIKRAFNNMPLAGIGSHPYLIDKAVAPHGARLRKKGNELIIPRYGFDGKLYSVQRIRQSSRGEKSWKGYFRGSRTKGTYFPLANKEDDKSILVICEGWATAASIYAATGFPVFVAFDSGNLAAVAKEVRKKYEKSRLLIAADHDQWVFAPGKKPKDIADPKDIAGNDPRWPEWREAGLLYNPGMTKAGQAAASIGGANVVAPDYTGSEAAKPTDMNDLVADRGADYVRELFKRILEIPQLAAEEAAPGRFHEPNPHKIVHQGYVPDLHPAGGGEAEGDMGLNFRVLGYNNGEYYYYPFAIRQIVTLNAAGHSMQNLLQLDKLDAWEKTWRDSDGKLLAKHATISLYAWDRLKSIAEKRGVFMEENRVRGSGAWIDDGRVVLHCGDALYVDGEFLRFESLKTEFTYVAAPRLLKPAAEGLTNAEAYKLRVICESATWENKLSGSLLAGWLVVAPICSALTYRPHIYVTGESDSGKSTIMEKVIKPVLGRMALCVDGGTTEPGIRDMMAYDGRPLVYDEAEPSPSMPEVIGLARKASTGAIVKKFGQRPFKARFATCFSAINPPVNKTADENRISFMHLKKNRKPTAMQDYDALLQLIEETIVNDFAEKMIARTLKNMNSLLANIRIFQRAVRKSTGAARASQQIGTMLAGLYLLGRTDVITEAAAMEWVSKHSWNDHALIDQEGDPIRLVQHLAGAFIRQRSGGDLSVGEMISLVSQDRDMAADKMLRNYGIAVRDGMVEIASRSANFARLLKDTDWHDKWSRTLSDVAGAEKRKIAYFAPGIKTSAVAVPLKLFIGEASAEQERIPDNYVEEEILF